MFLVILGYYEVLNTLINCPKNKTFSQLIKRENLNY